MKISASQSQTYHQCQRFEILAGLFMSKTRPLQRAGRYMIKQLNFRGKVCWGDTCHVIHPPICTMQKYHSYGDRRDTTTKQPISSATGKHYCIATTLQVTLDGQTDPYTSANHCCSPLLSQVSLACRWAIAYTSNYGKCQRLTCPNSELLPVSEVLLPRSTMSNTSWHPPRPPYHRREKPQGSTRGTYTL